MTEVSAQPAFETHLPSGRGFTWEDLQSIPDEDHWRYELVDGSLLVSPSPNKFHQLCVFNVGVLLDRNCPPHLQVLTAPFDFTPQIGVVLQPDVLMMDWERSDFNRTYVAPLLVVEVLSPGTRTTDRVLKRAVYAEHGVPSYWIMDVTDPARPSLLALELVDRDYEVVADVHGEGTATLERPFPVTVVPARLVDRRR